MIDKKLSKNFVLSELVLSQAAARAGLSNEPSPLIVTHLQQLVDWLLQPIRDVLGYPIQVSSGYRSVAVNHLVGGVDTSAHVKGFAADITCPGFGSPKMVAQYLAEALPKLGIKFDQIIWEFGDWVHVGLFDNDMRQRCQVLTARWVKGKAVYTIGITG
jgi:zinc D-Ala-D-Ala carboxypeptidase